MNMIILTPQFTIIFNNQLLSILFIGKKATNFRISVILKFLFPNKIMLYY